MKIPLDPLRFRANLYFDTGQPWQEFDWCAEGGGVDIKIGNEVMVRAFSRTQRCAATNVNLETASRDANIPLQLQQAFGHADMGIYLEVIQGGSIKLGNTVTPAE